MYIIERDGIHVHQNKQLSSFLLGKKEPGKAALPSKTYTKRATTHK